MATETPKTEHTSIRFPTDLLDALDDHVTRVAMERGRKIKRSEFVVEIVRGMLESAGRWPPNRIPDALVRQLESFQKNPVTPLAPEKMPTA